MGTITAQVIIDKAQIVLQDTTAVRWPETELLGWLNDAQRAICAVLPELNAITGNITLVLGTRQTLPTSAPAGITLLKIMRNMGVGGTTAGVALRKVPQELLDSQIPNWHDVAAATTLLRHYVYDQRAPKVFYVYPASVLNNTVEALYTAAPADITLGTAITIDDTYATTVMDYILYRAYSKDLEMAGNDTRAKDSMGAFVAFLGAKKSVDVANAPTEMVRG